MGATLAGVPLRAAVDAFGWRDVMAASALVTAIVAVTIFVVTRDDPSEKGFASYYPEGATTHSDSGMAASLREVLTYRNIAIPGCSSSRRVRSPASCSPSAASGACRSS
jgi:sugar phosphate permease